MNDELKKDETKQDDKIEAIKELGNLNSAQETQQRIHILSIIGQIEGHGVLPPQTKTTTDRNGTK